jgi:hypothetical protein
MGFSACRLQQDHPCRKLSPLQAAGGFRLLVDGKPVSFSGKVQKKSLEMLKCLVSLGGKEVRKEQLTDRQRLKRFSGSCDKNEAE